MKHFGKIDSKKEIVKRVESIWYKQKKSALWNLATVINLGHQLWFLTWHRQSHFPHSSHTEHWAAYLTLPVDLNHREICLLTNILSFWRGQVCPQDETLQGRQFCSQGSKPGQRRHREYQWLNMSPSQLRDAEVIAARKDQKTLHPSAQEGKKRIPGHFIQEKACTAGILCSLLYKTEVMEGP